MRRGDQRQEEDMGRRQCHAVVLLGATIPKEGLHRVIATVLGGCDTCAEGIAWKMGFADSDEILR